MNKNYIFLGPLYPKKLENEIKESSLSVSSNAPNVYQWNLLYGLNEILGMELRVINVLPVGTWKRAYRKLFLKDNDWISDGVNGHEIGCINLPFVKQWMRSKKTEKMLKRSINKETEIIIYSAYMPFLRAAYHMPKSVNVTAIITDLPEFYDLGNTSKLKKMLRKIQNCMIYKYLNRVDRFVVLTKQMCEPLHVGKRPCVCVEGIYNSDQEKTYSSICNKKAILYSGTLHYQYGIKNLLTAFENMENIDLELWICGSGEAEKEIKELAKKDSRIKFFGFCTQDEVAELRAKAMVLVNPRTNKGEYTKYSFPSKTMEYMASGKPVVMYKLDGIPDEYDEYLNYVPYSGDCVMNLKYTLLSVFDNYEESIAKANLAKMFVAEKKNSQAQAKKILSLIDGSKG